MGLRCSERWVERLTWELNRYPELQVGDDRTA
jgi:hypothetical protein